MRKAPSITTTLGILPLPSISSTHLQHTILVLRITTSFLGSLLMSGRTPLLPPAPSISTTLGMAYSVLLGFVLRHGSHTMLSTMFLMNQNATRISRLSLPCFNLVPIIGAYEYNMTPTFHFIISDTQSLTSPPVHGLRVWCQYKNSRAVFNTHSHFIITVIILRSRIHLYPVIINHDSSHDLGYPPLTLSRPCNDFGISCQFSIFRHLSSVRSFR